MSKDNRDPILNEVDELEKKIGQYNDHSLAYEMLLELKKANQRLWYIVIGIIVSTTILLAGGYIGHLWYLNNFDYVEYVQDGDGYNNLNVGNQGDVYNQWGRKSEL